MTAKTTDKTAAMRPENEKAPKITQKIGNTTFDIYVHFSETSKETFTDKVLRLIQNDVGHKDMR